MYFLDISNNHISGSLPSAWSKLVHVRPLAFVGTCMHAICLKHFMHGVSLFVLDVCLSLCQYARMPAICLKRFMLMLLRFHFACPECCRINC